MNNKTITGGKFLPSNFEKILYLPFEHISFHRECKMCSRGVVRGHKMFDSKNFSTAESL